LRLGVLFESIQGRMKKLPLIALLPLLSLVQPAIAETSTAVLEKRCSEQERQIRQLEEENSRLRSLLETASKMDAPKKVANSEPVAAAPTSAVPARKPSFYTVSQGDTLSRIARRNGTTPEVLAKLNKLKDVGLIRPGQKLLLPEKEEIKASSTQTISNVPAPKSSEKVESTPTARSGSHTVKDGETFFGIARKYGLGVNTLAEANPNVNPRSIRVGQTLKLVPREIEQPVAKAKSTPAPAPEPSLSPSETTSKPVSNQPLIRSIRIDKEINFGDFAAAHGMEPAKLNALNGLHLESNTVLAKGSELYVSAQP
jgi:LysM repeat protein